MKSYSGSVLVLPQAPSLHDTSIPQRRGHQQNQESSLRTHRTARSDRSQSAKKQLVSSNRRTGASPQQSPGRHQGFYPPHTQTLTSQYSRPNRSPPPGPRPLQPYNGSRNRDWPHYHNSDLSPAHNRSQSPRRSNPSQHPDLVGHYH